MGESPTVRFGLLGSLEATGDDGAPLDLGGSQPRTVLAMLLLASGQVVPVDSIIDGIWGERPPASASGTLQSYISRLRRSLEPDRDARAAPKVLVSESPGYRLCAEAADVDFRRFEVLAGEGRERLDAGDAAGARRLLTEAAALWRGPALVEFADQEFAPGGWPRAWRNAGSWPWRTGWRPTCSWAATPPSSAS